MSRWAGMLPATHPCGTRVVLDLRMHRWVDPRTSREHKCGEVVTVLADDDPRHGTANGYNNLRCRCRPCTVAHTAYLRARRAK